MQKMIDNDDQRADRIMHDEFEEKIDPRDYAPDYPNRAARRMIAKSKKIFKKPGLWGEVNAGHEDRVRGKK